MPVRDHVMWGPTNPFSDSRLINLPELVRDFRRGKLPDGWRGNKTWENRWLDLPPKPGNYYKEFYVGTAPIQAGFESYWDMEAKCTSQEIIIGIGDK